MNLNWVQNKLGDICLKITDGSHNPPKGIEISDYIMLSSKNIFDDEITYNKPRYLTESAFLVENKRTEVSPSDVLLTIVGTIGRAAVVPKDAPNFTLQRSVAVLKPNTSCVVPRFLMYLLQSIFETLNDGARGVAQKGIYLKTLRELLVVTPPLPEQKRIVAILDGAFAGISQAVANAEKNLVNARELFESYLNNVFTQPGENWIEKKLAEICSIKHGFAFKSQFFSTAGDYVVLTPGSFYEKGGFKDQGEKTKYYIGEVPDGYILNKGDFLFAMTEQAVGLLGSSLVVPRSDYFLHNQRLGLVKVIDKSIWHNDFFYHQFNTRYFRDAVQSTASGLKVRHTSPTKLGAITIFFPSKLSEQKLISSKLNDMKGKIESLESIYQQKLNFLNELKQSVLQKAFKGELSAESMEKVANG